MSEDRAPAVTAEALAWLDARPEPAPPELRQRMAEALAVVTAGTVPGALAEGALACLQATIAAPQERATALDLLAADALLTYALEAAAEIGAAAIREMTAAYGPDALAGLLPENEASTPASDQTLEGDTGTRGHGDAASEGAQNADAPTLRGAETTDAATRRHGDTASGEAPNADAPTPRSSEAPARGQGASPNNSPDRGDRLDSPSEDA